MVIPGGHKANVDYRTTLERPDGPGSMEGVLGAIPLYMEAGDVRRSLLSWEPGGTLRMVERS